MRQRDGSRKPLRDERADVHLFDRRIEMREREVSGLRSRGQLAALLGFESPLQRGRSVVALASSGAHDSNQLVNAMEDEGLVGRIHGDIAFVRDQQIDSYQVNNQYYVGYLPWHLRVWFFLSRHPVLLAVFGVLAGLILAFIFFWTLRGVAARRMRQ